MRSLPHCQRWAGRPRVAGSAHGGTCTNSGGGRSRSTPLRAVRVAWWCALDPWLDGLGSLGAGATSANHGSSTQVKRAGGLQGSSWAAACVGVGHAGVACSNVNDLAVDMAMGQFTSSKRQVVSAFACPLPMQRTRTITRADVPRSRPRTRRRRTRKGTFVPPPVLVPFSVSVEGAEKRPFWARTELWPSPPATDFVPTLPARPYYSIDPPSRQCIIKSPIMPPPHLRNRQKQQGSTRQPDKQQLGRSPSNHPPWRQPLRRPWPHLKMEAAAVCDATSLGVSS